MIYCVAYADVEHHLIELGFAPDQIFERTMLFVRGLDIVTLRRPNLDGHIPEILVDGAFDAAGLDPPPWNVFWCD